MSEQEDRTEEPPVDFTTLDDLFGFRLRMAQVRLFQHFRDNLAAFEITPGQAGLLILTRDNPGVSQSRLARAVQVERATLGQTLESLVARGLVVRERNDSDRRAYALRLSEKGERFVDRLIPAIRDHEAEAASALSPSEFERLSSLLKKFLS